MKVLMLAQFFPPDVGGEERHVLNLATALAGRGHEVGVATQLLPGTPPFEVLPAGVRVHRFTSAAMKVPGWYSDPTRPHHVPVPDPALTREITRLIDLERPAVVHAHNWIVNSVLAVRRTGAGRHPFRLVLTLHDYSNVCATKRMMRDGVPCDGPGPACLPCASRHYGPLVGLGTAAAVPLMRWWKSHAIDHVVAVSSAVARRNRLAEGRTPWSVIPNFVPDALAIPPAIPPAAPPHAATPGATADGTAEDRWPPEAGVPDGDFLLFAGDLIPDKGTAVLLEAYQRLGDGRPPLLMVGRPGGYRQADLPDGVRLAGPWPHATLMAAFRRCALAVLPSTWPDPCPTTVLEAMAAGRPVITTRTGGMVDMVEDGVSGILVPPGDPAALTGALRRLLDDPRLRAQLGCAGRDRVRQFTVSSVVARIEDVYRGVEVSRS